MCRCADVGDHLTPGDAIRYGYVDSFSPIATMYTLSSHGRFEAITASSGCVLYKCRDCGQLWESVVLAFVFLAAVVDRDLKRHEFFTDFDPTENIGVVLRKVHTSPDEWRRRIERNFTEVRKPALEAALAKYEKEGYTLVRSSWDYAKLKRSYDTKRFLGYEHITETIDMYIDFDGKVLCELVVSSDKRGELKHIRYIETI